MATSKKNNTNNSKWYWNWVTKQLCYIVAALILIFIVIYYGLSLFTRHNKELAVPSFVGMDIEEAQRFAKQKSLELHITDSMYISNFPKGAIFKQKPQEGSMVKKNRRILLTINSNNPRMVKMPSLAGVSLRQAQSELGINQLRVGRLIYKKDLATNNVLGQMIGGKEVNEGEEVAAGSEVDLFLGLNPNQEMLTIPDFSGVRLQNLKESMVENSMNLGFAIIDNTVKNYTDSLRAFVYDQVPAPNDSIFIPFGTVINVYLTTDASKIKPKVELPDNVLDILGEEDEIIFEEDSLSSEDGFEEEILENEETLEEEIN